MIKKLLLTLSFIALATIAFSGTTYAAQEGETIVITEELTKLINLYKEGVITEEEFSKAKSILLNPDSNLSKEKKKKKKAVIFKKPKLTAAEEKEELKASKKAKKILKKKKKLTAAERRDLEELEKEELKAAKKAERERKLDEAAEIERACAEDPQSKECRSAGASLKRLLTKIKIIRSATSIKEKKERELEKQASLEEQKRIKAENAAAKRAEAAAKKAEKKRLKAERKKACEDDPKSKECRTAKKLLTKILEKINIKSLEEREKDKEEMELEKQAIEERKKRITKQRELEKQASLEEKERNKAERAARKAERKRLKAEWKKACSDDPESKACKEGKRKKFLIF